MSQTVSVDQLAAAVMKELEEYADLATDTMKDAVKKSATTVKKETQAGAPVRSGAYQKSWRVKKMGESSTRLELVVHSSNRYQLAHLLEHGHAKRNGGRVAGKAHIAPAEAKGIEELEQRIKEGLSG